MPLVLKKTIADFNREELEAHVNLIRARRMLVAYDYAAGKKLELTNQSSKAERKYIEHVTMLGKELDRLDRALAAVDKRIDAMVALDQEYGLLQDLLAQE